MSRAETSSETIKSWISEFPGLIFLEDQYKIKCSFCNVTLPTKRKSVIVQHISTKKHKISSSDVDEQTDFNIDLAKFMVGCNIPWNQLQNPCFRNFLNKCINGEYIDVNLPSAVTLRNKYLPTVYTEVKTSILTELNDKYIWLGVDETTNACGSKVANVTISALEEQAPSKVHLFASKILEKTNAQSIAQLVDDCLRELWGEQFETKKYLFLLFLTDGASYMKVAGKLLQLKYSALHLTCLAHGLHRVAEKIRECYPKVDLFISNIKKIFLKAPDRVNLFHSMLPNVSLPPSPVLTRWGTWLEAATYYHNNYDDIVKIIYHLNPADALCIRQTQELISDKQIKTDLGCIYENFSRIPAIIMDLEKRPDDNFNFIHSVNSIRDFSLYISQLKGETANIICEKFNNVLGNNPGFYTTTILADLLSGKEVNIHDQKILHYMRHHHLFRYAPISSVDVERSFSEYKWIFNEKRRRLKDDNLEKILIIYYYLHNNKLNNLLK